MGSINFSFKDRVKNKSGSGAGALIMGVSIVILLFTAFLSIADYAVYSMNF